MNSFGTMPEKGCELKDVAFDELESATSQGGWVVVHCYTAEWKSTRSYTETTGAGMRYLIARVDPEAAMGILRKELEDERSKRFVAESARDKDQKDWQVQRVQLEKYVADLSVRVSKAESPALVPEEPGSKPDNVELFR